jgi:TRAP-type uncharacterized transport system substrate-binding protein
MEPGMNIARIICAGVVMLAGSAAAQDGGKAIQKTTISLGTATPGGGFPLYGNAFAEALNEADPTLSIEPRNTKGSTEYPLLEAGQLDIARPPEAGLKPSPGLGGRGPISRF